MNEIKFYCDEHVQKSVTDALKRRGVDVLTVQEAGRNGLSDGEQLDYATQDNRVMVTMDSDFLILASQDVQHSGIAFILFDTPISEQINGLLLIHDVLMPAEMENHIEFI